MSIAIGFCTYFIVKNQTRHMRERAAMNGIFISHLLYKHMRQVMLRGDRDEINDYFVNIGKSWEVQRVFMFDEHGDIGFSSEQSDIDTRVDDYHYQLFERGNAPIKYEIIGGQKKLVVVKTIENEVECQRCHGTGRPILGGLGIDISLVDEEREIARNRNWIISFAFILLVLISSVISVLVIMLVKRPTKRLMCTMMEVEKGNLSARVNVKNRDELGVLGESFNSMISSLERLGIELSEQHDQQIRQMEKMASLGELSSSIAHEIKNPLAGIGAAIQVLSSELKLEKTHGEVIDEITKQLKRMDKNIKDLLSFARPVEPKFMESNLNEIIERAKFYVKQSAERQNIRIEEGLEPTIPNIFVDPEQMQQVLLNVMLNAVQAMPDGGSLSIVTRLSESMENHDEKGVEVSVSDTGVGIPTDQIHKVFKPFFTTKYRGTGLGLSISQAIVERHGGKLTVRSEPGRGTIINIALPMHGGT
jgi:signal transduction histidine kinase